MTDHYRAPERSAHFRDEPVFEPASWPFPDAPAAVDAFCGCGGLSEGVRQAGFATALAFDAHAPSVEAFRANHPEAATFLGDIRLVPDAAILEALDGRPVDLLVGGVPCQGFSVLSSRRDDRDPRNRLFREYMRLLRLLRPRYAIMENVPTIEAAGRGTFAEAIRGAFYEAGYSATADYVSALDWGVPQTRVRWIVAARRGDLSAPWPVPPPVAPATVEDAIGDLPSLGPGEEVGRYGAPPYRAWQARMRGRQAILTSHRAPDHPPETVARIAATPPGHAMYESFRQRVRLAWDRPSPTQYAGGIRPQFAFGHPRDPRGLSIRERARIQGFPDSYVFPGGIVQGRVLTGNAVPPPLAAAFARAFADEIRGTSTVQVVRVPEQMPLLRLPSWSEH